MNVEEMTKLFIDSRKRGTDGARKRCGDATVRIYRRNLGIFSNFLLEQGVIVYQNLRRMHILALVDFIEVKQREGKWAKATALQFWRSLKSFFIWVEKDEDCQADGLKSMQRYLPAIEKCPRKEYIPMTADLKKFRNSFETHKPYALRNYTAFSLMLDSGIRCGELCNLKVEDILEAENLIIVDGKTGRRAVPITDSTMRLLKAWLKKRRETAMGQKSPYVFISKYQEQLTVNGVGQAFRKLKAKHGLTDITPHTLRHSFATFYLMNGGDIERLRNNMGHSGYEILRGYLHTAKVGSKEAKAELERCSVLKSL